MEKKIRNLRQKREEEEKKNKKKPQIAKKVTTENAILQIYIY